MDPWREMALTFDDVLFVPAYSEVLSSDTDISVELAPSLRLKIPILSAAMDTVTEADLAIVLAREEIREQYTVTRQSTGRSIRSRVSKHPR